MSDAEEIIKDEEASGTTVRRLSDAEFAEARELYELGKSGLGDLADMFGISRQALSKRFKDAGAKKGSRAHELAAAAASAAKAATADRYIDKRAEWIEETRIEGVKVLQQIRLLARKVVSDAMKAAPARSLASVDDDMKTVQRFNKIIVDNIASSLEILRANEHVNEEDLPKLTLEDLTNEEILQHHKNTGALSEDTTIEEMLAETINIGDLDG